MEPLEADVTALVSVIEEARRLGADEASVVAAELRLAQAKEAQERRDAAVTQMEGLASVEPLEADVTALAPATEEVYSTFLFTLADAQSAFARLRAAH